MFKLYILGSVLQATKPPTPSHLTAQRTSNSLWQGAPRWRRIYTQTGPYTGGIPLEVVLKPISAGRRAHACKAKNLNERMKFPIANSTLCLRHLKVVYINGVRIGEHPCGFRPLTTHNRPSNTLACLTERQPVQLASAAAIGAVRILQPGGLHTGQREKMPPRLSGVCLPATPKCLSGFRGTQRARAWA